MCGAFGISGKSFDLEGRFNINRIKYEFKPSYNIRPSKRTIVITNQNNREAEEKTFGITPSWNDKQLLINAKAETIDQLKSFKKAFETRRCLIPASYFFEWKKLSDGKLPYLFKLKDDSIFSFAGIYTDDGFAIITTTPNHLMEDIHDRMPVILPQEHEEDWLNPDNDPSDLVKLLSPFPDKLMVHYPVSSLVNSAKNDYPEILTPLK